MAVRRAAVAAASAATLSLSLLVTSCNVNGAASAAEPKAQPPAKKAVATGSGGAVSSVNPYASRAGIEVLRKGATPWTRRWQLPPHWA